MAFNFLQSLIDDGAGPSFRDDNIDLFEDFDDENESNIEVELIQTFNEVSSSSEDEEETSTVVLDLLV